MKSISGLNFMCMHSTVSTEEHYKQSFIIVGLQKMLDKYFEVRHISDIA